MVSKTTLVIACGAIAHELVAVLKASAWDHVTIQCLPAEWHNTPVHIAPGVEKKIIENKEAFDRILIAYGDCGTGGILDDVIKRHNVQRLPGNHCYDFFAGVERFAALADEELGTFYLTDYLAAHFDRLILDGLGITSHPELRDMYFAHYTRLVYLAQSPTSQLIDKAKTAADTLGLQFELHETGLKPFTDSLRSIKVHVQSD